MICAMTVKPHFQKHEIDLLMQCLACDNVSGVDERPSTMEFQTRLLPLLSKQCGYPRPFSFCSIITFHHKLIGLQGPSAVFCVQT